MCSFLIYLHACLPDESRACTCKKGLQCSVMRSPIFSTGASVLAAGQPRLHASDALMNTAARRGMVASAFEFAEVCRKHDYHNFVFSMKASNPLVMVQVSSPVSCHVTQVHHAFLSRAPKARRYLRTCRHG